MCSALGLGVVVLISWCTQELYRALISHGYLSQLLILSGIFSLCAACPVSYLLPQVAKSSVFAFKVFEVAPRYSLCLEEIPRREAQDKPQSPYTCLHFFGNKVCVSRTVTSKLHQQQVCCHHRQWVS